MGKRSNFKRRKHDQYDTPEAAVVPLLPHLKAAGGFIWEPCAGNYQLAEALKKHGVSTMDPIDIAPRDPRVRKADAMLSTSPIGVTAIVTNPPWTREILHPMIEHFSAMRPTWLLFDADWAHTKQAEPYLKWCRKIVSVGRVKWIPDSPHTGKDNCAWYLFDKLTRGATEFVGRAA